VEGFTLQVVVVHDVILVEKYETIREKSDVALHRKKNMRARTKRYVGQPNVNM